MTNLVLGIKIGPDNWPGKLATGIKYAEIYFDWARIATYPPMLDFIRKNKIDAGLHLSSRLENGIVPDLLTKNQTIWQKSVDLLLKTIDYAQKQNLKYVVFHPGSYRVIQLQKNHVKVLEKTPQNQSLVNFKKALKILAGKSKNCAIYPETLPGVEWYSFAPANRIETVDAGFPSWRAYKALGVPICLDLNHTFSEIIYRYPQSAWLHELQKACRELAAVTGHIHIATNLPPFNGTDSHGGFLPEDYQKGAIPTLEDLAGVLKLFTKTKRQIMVVPEPEGGVEVHLENYQVLLKEFADIIKLDY